MIQRNDIGYRIGQSHPRGSRYSDAVVEQARCLHEQGKGYGTIAAMLRVPRYTVRNWATYQSRNQYPAY